MTYCVSSYEHASRQHRGAIGKNKGLEVNNEDVEELLEDHKDELSTEELEQLQKRLKKLNPHSFKHNL
jgi:hypothetical protein